MTQDHRNPVFFVLASVLLILAISAPAESAGQQSASAQPPNSGQQPTVPSAGGQPAAVPQASPSPSPAQPVLIQNQQSCQTHDEIPATVRAALETAAQQAFDQASHGDVSGLRAGSTNALQSSFGGVAAAVMENQAALVGAKTQIRSLYVLNTGATPGDGHYVCGAFAASGLAAGTAGFNLPGLASGKYAIVIQDVTGPKGPFAMTTVLEDLNAWKLAGFYFRAESANGHDGLWYLLRAREFKAKDQRYNAWFYYVTSWDLLAAVKFMETNLLGKIIQESAGMQPPDAPLQGNVTTFSANGKNYKLTDVSVYRTDNSLDISLKYAVPSAADFTATQTDARSLAAAYAARHPEIKDAFDSIMAHAIDPAGADVVGLVSLKK